MIKHSLNSNRAGFTLVEILVTSSLFTVIMLSSMALMERDANLSKSTLSLAALEDRSGQMLHKIEREMADALISSPTAILATALVPGTSSEAVVSSTLGFPEQGFLMLSRGTADFEIVSYDSLGPGIDRFSGLTRGLACTPPATHDINMEIVWAGLAEPIADQTAPPASSFDGIALEEGTGVFFRGAGAGISFRVPVDPAGGTSYLSGEDIQWGSSVANVPILSGWNAIEFVPTSSFTEASTGDDINKDGDVLDTFDIGQLRRRSWDTNNPGGTMDDLGLGPSAILQEQCQWGSDLDNDGFEDPIFLWNEETRTLHIRLFLVGRSVKDLPIVRRVESVLFLRNENAL